MRTSPPLGRRPSWFVRPRDVGLVEGACVHRRFFIRQAWGDSASSWRWEGRIGPSSKYPSGGIASAAGLAQSSSVVATIGPVTRYSRAAVWIWRRGRRCVGVSLFS